SEGLLDLIYHEVVLRQRHGETPLPEEYGRRFPHLTEQLRMLFRCHRAITAGSLPGPSTLPPTRLGLTPGGAGAGAGSSGPVPAGYEVLGELGSGGMGAVFRVRDPRLRRDLALKLLRPQHAARADLRQRFLEEAQIAGQLQHPGIVPIHELGTLAD